MTRHGYNLRSKGYNGRIRGRGSSSARRKSSGGSANVWTQRLKNVKKIAQHVKHHFNKPVFKRRKKNKPERDKSETSETLVHEPSRINKLIIRKIKPKNLKLAHGENMLYTSHNFLLKSAPNRRYLHTIGAANTISQWNTATVPAAFDQSPVAYFDLNPSRKITGSGYFGSIVPAADMFLHTKTVYDIQVMNAANSVAHMEFFVCEYKIDTTIEPTALWNDGLGRDGLTRPFWDLATGAPGYMSLDSAIFVDPMQSTTFRNTLKVLYQKKLSLAGGSLEHVRLDVVDNFYGRLDKIQSITGGTKYMKGSTIVFFTHFGQLGVFDNAGTDVCGNSESAVGVKVDKRDYFRSVASSVNRLRSNIGAEVLQVDAPTFGTKFMNVVENAVTLLETF